MPLYSPKTRWMHASTRTVSVHPFPKAENTETKSTESCIKHPTEEHVRQNLWATTTSKKYRNQKTKLFSATVTAMTMLD
eukprot:2600858-Amphidinium_carterae.1